MEDFTDQAIALIRKLQDLPPPLTAQAKFLLLSRSRQSRLTHFSCVLRPPLALGPLAKPQTAVEDATFAILILPSDSDTAATMGLHHPLERMQHRLPLREGGFGHNATDVVPDSSALSTIAHFRCTLLHSSPRRRIATTPFPRHLRLSHPSRSFTLCPPAPTRNPVPLSMPLCGALSRISILPCTLLSVLLCRLTLRSSQCRLTLSPSRSGQRVPSFCKH
jgi:hypothetical protein